MGIWQHTRAEPIVLSNLPAAKQQSTEGAAGKLGQSDVKKNKQSAKSGKTKKTDKKMGTKTSAKASPTEQAVLNASRRMDEWLMSRQGDPFFRTHATILKKMGPQLVHSGIPPDYWPEAVAFAYGGLSVQTQQLMKILQQIETLERHRYEQEMALHLQKPRLIPKPVLNLEPLYVLRRQLIELSARQ